MQAHIAIFEDALEQLAVLGDISQDVTRNGGEKKPLGEEIKRILRDQQTLEARFQNLAADQEKLKNLPNKMRFKENQIAMMDVTNELQQSTHALAKNLKSHPSVAQNLIKIQNEQANLQTLINKTIRELREYKYDSLRNACDEEKRKKNTLQNTINREKEASDLQRSLQKELANERKLLEEEVNERNAVIQQLKDTIQEINRLTNSEQKYIKKETKAHESSVRQCCQVKESELLEEKSEVAKKIELEMRAYEQIVDFLTRQRKGLETQIQEWMVKYEEDTESKANELESLKQKRTADLDKFEELVAAYEELEKVVEEDRQVKAREAEEKRLMNAKIAASTKIQRWWRKTLALRKASAKPAKKGGKKEKKGGGKKKK
ncbi:hypothetical protein HK100_004332 [Physocladia obscura]|uniref:Dynein regulatory complex protein 9 n=1 Tax=Physocladia obscura TaxID=109957 RepID=A0AAD5STZ7_9FUNG|nr:hypothetical protein HK100_004332 [Physocladia obscura]